MLLDSQRCCLALGETALPHLIWVRNTFSFVMENTVPCYLFSYFLFFCFAVDADCSPRAKAVREDASGQMRIYTPSVISVLQKHLQTSDPDVGGPLENMVLL